jgi:hypothetical protein
MMILAIIMAVMHHARAVALAAVSAAFGLERSLHLCKLRSETTEHSLNDMVGPNAKALISNFSRQMPISQMPSKTHELIRICMPDFDNKLRGGLILQQPPVVKLQGISIGHRHRLWKVEKDIFAFIRTEANAAAMACVKIQGDSASCLFLRPMPRRAMN